jgi:hypothetical protein
LLLSNKWALVVNYLRLYRLHRLRGLHGRSFCRQNRIPGRRESTWAILERARRIARLSQKLSQGLSLVRLILLTRPNQWLNLSSIFVNRSNNS